MRTYRWTLFVTIFALVLSPAPNALATCILCGDCDRSGSIDILDSLMASQIAAGTVSPSICQMSDCDVDGSGTIDDQDAQMIAEVAVGLPTQLTCPPVVIPPSPAIGYCVIGGLNSMSDWQIVVADSDPFTFASFTSPPQAVPELQLATVNNPWPAAGTIASVGAFITAVNGTLPFADLVNGGMANFGAVAAGTFGGITCFAPYVQNLGAGGVIHNASLGILNSDGTVCFPQPLPGGTFCPFNPTLLAVPLDPDGGIPGALTQFVEGTEDEAVIDYVCEGDGSS